MHINFIATFIFFHMQKQENVTDLGNYSRIYKKKCKNFTFKSVKRRHLEIYMKHKMF